MVTCPYCNQRNEAGATDCRFCGGPLPAETKSLEWVTFDAGTLDGQIGQLFTWQFDVAPRGEFTMSLPRGPFVLRHIWIVSTAFGCASTMLRTGNGVVIFDVPLLKSITHLKDLNLETGYEIDLLLHIRNRGAYMIEGQIITSRRWSSR